MVTSLQLGFGLALGSRIVSYWVTLPLNEITSGCESRLSVFLVPLFLILIMCAFNIRCKCKYSQWWSGSLAAVIGYISFNLLSKATFDTDTATAVSAFFIGSVAQALSYYFGEVSLSTIVIGILLLVPGGLGVRGAATLFHSASNVNGVEFGLSMIKIGFGITMGLLLAKALFGSNFLLKKQTVNVPLNDTNASAQQVRNGDIDPVSSRKEEEFFLPEVSLL